MYLEKRLPPNVYSIFHLTVPAARLQKLTSPDLPRGTNRSIGVNVHKECSGIKDIFVLCNNQY